MYQGKKEENAVDQTPVSESMIPLKLCLTFDPPQIGIVYRKTKADRKKHIYIIQLNSLILLGDAEKITQQLYEKHAAYLSQKKIRPQQVDSRLPDLQVGSEYFIVHRTEADGLRRGRTQRARRRVRRRPSGR